MNVYQRDLKLGLERLRADGMNFTKFKTELRMCFVHGDRIDEDRLVDCYNIYACCVSYVKHRPYDTIAQWAAQFFRKYNRDSHDYWLTSRVRNQTMPLPPAPVARERAQVVKQDNEKDHAQNDTNNHSELVVHGDQAENVNDQPDNNCEHEQRNK